MFIAPSVALFRILYFGHSFCPSTLLRAVSLSNRFVLRISNFGFTVMRGFPGPLRGGFLSPPAMRVETSVCHGGVPVGKVRGSLSSFAWGLSAWEFGGFTRLRFSPFGSQVSLKAYWIIWLLTRICGLMGVHKT